MASIIRIKRSSTSGNPSTLGSGELAYSSLTGTQLNGGDRVFIGVGTETAGDASNHHIIGGKYFTDMLDHVHGTVTADSALIVDSSSKLDVLNVDNLTLNGNDISSTNTNGNITIDPNGTGYVSIIGTNGFVLPVGTTAQQGPAVAGAIRLNSTSTQFEGYSGTNWSSLGGVRSVDGLTYISAESTPAASDDTIRFYSNGTLQMSLDTDSLDIAATVLSTNLNATTVSSTANTGALVVIGGVGIGGNLNVAGDFGLTGGIALSGDVAINGGDLYSTSGTFNLLNKDSSASGTNDGPTTINAFLNSSAINVGATSSTITFNDAVVATGNLRVVSTSQLDGATTIGASGTRVATTVYGTTVDITGSSTTKIGVEAATGSAITFELKATNSVGDANLDINVDDTVTLDATAISIDATDTSNFSITTNSSSNKSLVFDATNSGTGEAIIAVGSASTDKVNITSSALTTLTTDEVQADVTTLDINAKYVTIDTVGAGNSLIVTSTDTTINSTTATLQGTAGSGTDMTLNMTGQFNIDNVRIDGNTISTTDGSNILYLDASPVGNNGLVIIKGDLQIDGNTTTINSTTVTIDDPVFTLGGDTAPTTDDNLDRGIEFKWHDGVNAKLGFYGYDDSDSEFVLIASADNTAGVYTPSVAGVFGNARFSKLALVDSTASTTTSSGALIVTGGVGIGGQLNVGGATNKFTAATTCSSTTTGTVVVTGGVGIGGTVYIGTNLTGAGAATSTIDGFQIDGGTY
ncbi:hypothetical protein UFOVP1655_233 [uncultured Caudovirales phage]|uniref:Major tropism determinant N-terminal domain-containing protein n=1 Tax=uncultured Caudovirales phage TaxID=2100421 RepID=A0A6J5T554_9CAUD|nr:hypothetical protein UFOVP1655_233 [uncultured Caudovirales phage]